MEHAIMCSISRNITCLIWQRIINQMWCLFMRMSAQLFDTHSLQTLHFRFKMSLAKKPLYATALSNVSKANFIDLLFKCHLIPPR